VYGVAFSPRGDQIATGSWDQTARIWDPATGECLASLAGHLGTVEAVTFSPSGDLLATASGDATARIWKVSTGACVATLTGHDYTVRAVAFSPSGDLLATASADATARIWSVSTGACLATLVPLPGAGYITLLPDGRYKLDGDPGDCLWWAAGLGRLGADEVGSRFPDIQRLSPGTPILPAD
jgi:WD40 repeat protein